MEEQLFTLVINAMLFGVVILFLLCVFLIAISDRFARQRQKRKRRRYKFFTS